MAFRAVPLYRACTGLLCLRGAYAWMALLAQATAGDDEVLALRHAARDGDADAARANEYDDVPPLLC